jgi:ankyrin repeat protein
MFIGPINVILIEFFKIYWTPLMLACTRDNLNIIKYLLEKKADLNQVNKDGWNAFQIAIRYINNNSLFSLIKLNI